MASIAFVPAYKILIIPVLPVKPVSVTDRAGECSGIRREDFPVAGIIV